jgi:hypothetical protein
MFYRQYLDGADPSLLSATRCTLPELKTMSCSTPVVRYRDVTVGIRVGWHSPSSSSGFRQTFETLQMTARCYAGAPASCSSRSANALSSHSRARRAALLQVGGWVEIGGKGASASMVAMRR